MATGECYEQTWGLVGLGMVMGVEGYHGPDLYSTKRCAVVEGGHAAVIAAMISRSNIAGPRTASLPSNLASACSSVAIAE